MEWWIGLELMLIGLFIFNFFIFLDKFLQVRSNKKIEKDKQYMYDTKMNWYEYIPFVIFFTDMKR